MTESTRYTMTMTEAISDELHQVLQVGSEVEHAAFVVCGVSRTDGEVRLLGRKVLPLAPEEILYQDALRMQVSYSAVFRALDEAVAAGGTLLFVHTHPTDAGGFSAQDDREEKVLARVAGNYNLSLDVIATGVLTASGSLSVRAWSDSQPVDFSRVRVLGRRLEFPVYEEYHPDYRLFDRQVRAFGREIQRLLAGLTVGVVGCGGTGSAVAEQLVRLGVGHLILFDEDIVEDTNLSRIHESAVSDIGRRKVEVLCDRLGDVHPGTRLEGFGERIVAHASARRLRECDVVFGCTDDDLGRYILNKLALDYLIPVFDMAAKIDSRDERITSVVCRVTRLQPGHACLTCRNRLSSDRMMRDGSPEEYAELVRQKYAEELEDADPAVIPFTTVAAGLAVSLFIDHLTGYRGTETDTDELLLRFDTLQTIKSGRRPDDGCWCADAVAYGIGDRQPFLGMVWAV